METAGPALGEAQMVSDLLQAHFSIIVHFHELAFLIAQTSNGLAYQGTGLFEAQRLFWKRIVGVFKLEAFGSIDGCQVNRS